MSVNFMDDANNAFAELFCQDILGNALFQQAGLSFVLIVCIRIIVT